MPSLPAPPPPPLRTKRPRGCSVPQLFPSCYSFSWSQPPREGLEGAAAVPAPPSLVLSSPPTPCKAWGALRDWLWSSSHPFGGIPSGVQQRKRPGLSRAPLLCLASKGEEGEEGHCSQSGTPDPLLSCHLLSGPGPVAGEKSLPAANMNDPPSPAPPPLPNPGDPGGLRASLPRIWLQFARSTSGCVSTSFVGCQGCERP